MKDSTGIFYMDNIYFWMAWCYGKKRNYQLEEAYYRKTLDIFPEAENAMNNLGYSLFKQKKYHDAEEVFRKCAKIGIPAPSARSLSTTFTH